MLTKIRLENFKSWQKLDLDLSNLTILFGTNSSGKSSALDALLLLKQTATGFDRYQPINLGGEDRDYVDFGSYRDLVFAHDELQQVGIHLEWYSRTTFRLLNQREHESNSFEANKLTYTVHWQRLPDRTVVKQLDYGALSQD